jgi:uncharacterized circularly permuted ATP-grasp superfamily protein/uncharacterized alpha-E superfamily protein
MIDPRSLTPHEGTGPAPFDELRGSDGALRPPWQRYFDVHARLSDAEAKARWTRAKQLLQENGTSYNVHGEGSASTRPWRLSPIPLVIGADEWLGLTRGLTQRTRLLRALLRDLYGPQTALSKGALPSELVLANPRFLRPVHGAGANRVEWLPLYAADLIRAPDGRFHVLADSTQAPAGMGYALENRVVVSHVLADHLRQCNVERLAGFFQLVREQLRDAAPHNRDSPRIGVLTPGPGSTTYFEQTYLAKYFGVELVQGEDLTVREDRVFLKTLGGLQQVDVLLRRVADELCDPLELRADSVLGVPGLAQAVRSGNVCVQNPLGSGLLETPALLAYLPALCQLLLGEELLLPSVPTYYCGDARQLEVVLSDFDSMVIKSARSAGRAAPTFVRELAPDARERLRQEVRSTPDRYVGQRFVPSSRIPVITDGSLCTRAFVLRCFAATARTSDTQIMPGGLALVATLDSELQVSLHRGARSKDVWVLSDEPISASVVASVARRPVELSRGGGDLPSRVADNLYWLGRYTERAESVGRLARVIAGAVVDGAGRGDADTGVELGRLLAALRLQARFIAPPRPPTDEPVPVAEAGEELLAAIADATQGGSLVSSIRSALRVGKLVRDRLSRDTWRLLASLNDTVERLPAVNHDGGLPALLDELNLAILGLIGFSGQVMESMTRGFAWRFLDMGRRLERAVHLVGLVRLAFVAPCARDVPLIEAVLDVADSGMTYRRRYLAGFQRAPAVDLLVADETNPRSVAFQLRTLAEHIGALPPRGRAGVRSTQQRLLLSATSRIELADIEDLVLPDPADGNAVALDALLEQVGRVLPALSDSLTEAYLYPAEAPRNLGLFDRGATGRRTGEPP